MEAKEMLLEKNGDECDGEASQTWISRRSSTKSTWSWTSFVALGSLAINALFIMNFLSTTKSRNSPAERFNQQLYSPAQSVLESEIVTFNGKFGLNASAYSGFPTPENNATWEALYHNGISQISADEARPMLNKTLPIPGDTSNYITSLSVFHVLHCLNMVRLAIYNGTDWSDHDGLVGITHIDHCLNAVRQSLMCNPDITPLTFAKDTRDGESRQIMAAPHSCRKWENLREWAEEHALQREFDYTATVEDDPLGWGRHTVQEEGLGLEPLPWTVDR